ncbi:MAG: FMN-binding negative transcriptional regulator [Chitinophagales bacterium]|nr:FMN-binding negative transcriptional regulator [Chitinophagales bacterium]
MYIPPHFKQEDKQAIEQLVREFSFATLISIKDTLPWATHIPLELEIRNGNWFLHGHMAKANPQWKNFESQPEVLAVFMGPHTYVSPSWYNHRNVPTWNYMAAHLYGKVKLVEGEALEAMLKNLMLRYESAHAKHPQAYEEIPPKTLEMDLRGVVGFEIAVERIDASFKLSQNRDAESYASVIEQLKKLKAYDAERIALEMEKHKQP